MDKLLSEMSASFGGSGPEGTVCVCVCVCFCFFVHLLLFVSIITTPTVVSFSGIVSEYFPLLSLISLSLFEVHRCRRRS